MKYILVCGGREYDDRKNVYRKLDLVLKNTNDNITIVHGAARGADTLAEDWAKSRQVNYRGFPAKWDKFKKRAGTLRNKEMIDDNVIDLVIAFPGGNGTAGMIRLAKEANIDVIEVKDSSYD